MRIRTDDELRRVDARWLGPPRVSFPWPATRYVAYGVGFVIFLLVGWLFARFVEVSFWTMVYTLMITIGITGWVCKRIDDERPLSALPAVLWAELGTPRRSPQDEPAVSTVSWVGLTFVLADARNASRRHPPGLLSIPSAPTGSAKGRRSALVAATVVISDAA
jgi:hypothetical protein